MRHSASLALLLLGTNLCQTATTPPPGAFEVDLIYPRNLTVSSDHPIPVLFGIQNPILANNLVNFSISWQLYPANDPDMKPAPGAQGGVIRLGEFNEPIPSTIQVSYADKLTGIEDHWRFTWSILKKNCTDHAFPPFIVEYNELYFTTSRSGPSPDLVAATAANTCNSTTSLGWEVVTFDNRTDPSCAVVGSGGPPPANPCAIQINSTEADSIADRIKQMICNDKYANISQSNVSCPANSTAYNATNAPPSAAMHGFKTSWSVLMMAGFVALAGPFLIL